MDTNASRKQYSLPIEVLELVVLHLPLLSFISCRAVCKVWNQFLRTPTFIRDRLQLKGQASESESWLLSHPTLRRMNRNGSGYKRWFQLYDPSRNKRFKLMCFPSKFDAFAPLTVVIVGSYIFGFNEDLRVILAWNPITRHEEEIPIEDDDTTAVVVATPWSHRLILYRGKAISPHIKSIVNLSSSKMNAVAYSRRNGMRLDLRRNKWTIFNRGHLYCFYETKISITNAFTLEVLNVSLPAGLYLWNYQGFVICNGDTLVVMVDLPRGTTLGKDPRCPMEVWVVTQPPDPKLILASQIPQAYYRPYMADMFKCVATGNLLLFVTSNVVFHRREEILVFNYVTKEWYPLDNRFHTLNNCIWTKTLSAYYPSFAPLEITSASDGIPS